jgi:uncharacterized protein
VGERSSYTPGTFSWVELLTSDAGDAKRFYGGLFGWEYEDTPVGDDNVYSIARLEGKSLAGTYEPPPEQGTPPNWLSYVSVENVDEVAAKAAELGATVMAGPFDVTDAGRMAVIQDPTGAAFGAWQANRHIGAELVNVPGALTMTQLNTSDPEAAGRFYSELFGWDVEPIDTGGGPPYFSIHNQGALNAGMMSPGSQTQSHWIVYFVTADLDGDTERISELGGELAMPPTQIPSGRFAVAIDPQGAYFALFEGRLDP